MKIKNLKTGAYPLIVHAPTYTLSKHIGDPEFYHVVNPLWRPIFNKWKSQKAPKAVSSCAEELTVITWNNALQKTLLEESLERLGIRCLCLGRTLKEWKHRYKLTTVAEVIDSIRTPYILGLDAYDCIVLRDLGEAVEKFKAMDCDALFNGQMTFYPDCVFNREEKAFYITKEMKDFEKSVSDTPWAYLNAGAWMAKTRFYGDFVKHCLTLDIEALVAEGILPERVSPHQVMAECDQIIIHYFFKEYYPRIKVDNKNEIFINLCRIPAFRGYVRMYRKFYEIPIPEWKVLFAEQFKPCVEFLKLPVKLFVKIFKAVGNFLPLG